MPSLNQSIKHMRRQLVSRIKYAINPQLLYGKTSFYEDTRDRKLHSVEVIAELIVEHFNPKTVVDIGCGEGLFLNALYKRNVQVIGSDISEAAIKLAPKDFIVFQSDATKPIRYNKTFDLCLCIEIAEHIPNKYSKTLVENATLASDTVFFTAAPPGQGGVGHINEQPPEFWIRLFEAQGFTHQTDLSTQLRHRMKDQRVLEFLYKNVMIFTRNVSTT